MRFIVRWILILLFLGLIGCATSPALKPMVDARSQRVVDYALSLQGTPYRYGKASPREGFDCSGFVNHVYRIHGVELPRTTRAMAHALPAVERGHRKPGDLLFFDTEGKHYSHVGLYVGQDRFVHAPSRHTGRVIVSDLHQNYWWHRFTGVRRPPDGEIKTFSSLSTRGIP